MTRVLVMDAPFDLPTVYLASAMDKIASGAAGLGAEVVQVRGDSANIWTLIELLQSFVPDYVFLGGHGNANLITMANLEPLLIACQNDEVLAGLQSFFISCLCGLILVPSVVRKGGVAAAGFTEEYAWVITPPYVPAEDPTWRPFERLIVEPALEAVRGGGARGWYNKLQAVATEEERIWGQSTEPIASQVLMFLRQDKRAATFVDVGGGEVSGILPLVLLYALTVI